MVGLGLGADVGDAAESPFENGDLHEAGPEGGDYLGAEHDARSHFHVVPEFEILHEGERLRHGDVAVRFEEHHG